MTGRDRLRGLAGTFTQALTTLSDPDRPICVLVVDDEALNRRVFRRHLTDAGCDLLEASDGREALSLLDNGQGADVDVIVLDLLMPGMGGQDFLEQFRANPAFHHLPVLVATNLTSVEEQEAAFDAGASDFLSKPINRRELIARTRSLARLKRGLEQLDDAEKVILSLARALEAKDDATEGHCERLSLLCVGLGRALGLTQRELRALDRGGVLHDIGKVGVADSILFKEGPLDTTEWISMRMHPVVGDEMVAPLRSLQDVRPIIRHHHEKWDGSGYPDGLKGDQIPITARVLRVVDAYDALRSPRPYKVAFSHAEAAEILREEAAMGWFEPAMVERALAHFTSEDLPEGLGWPTPGTSAPVRQS